jgi:hypothetical protein
MKKTKPFLISFLILAVYLPPRIFPQVYDINDLLTDTEEVLNKIYTSYYEGKDIPFDDIQAGLKKADLLLHEYGGTQYKKRIWLLYLYSGEIRSSLYSSVESRIFRQEIEIFDKKITSNIKTITKDPDLCLAYANYLYSKLSRETDNFGIVNDLPVLYRRILLADPDNYRAGIKLALWYIYASGNGTNNWNSYIRLQEPLLERLSEIERFNAYILYSMFYMKSYKTGTGWDYLDKAESLFPQNPSIDFIRYNYETGKLSW